MSATEATELAAILAEQRAEEAKRMAWEAVTVGMKDDDGKEWTIATLRAAFNKLHPGGDWKRPVDVLVPVEGEPTLDELVTFCRAVEFFQGNRPKLCAFKPHVLGDSLIRVTSRGYVC